MSENGRIAKTQVAQGTVRWQLLGVESLQEVGEMRPPSSLFQAGPRPAATGSNRRCWRQIYEKIAGPPYRAVGGKGVVRRSL